MKISPTLCMRLAQVLLTLSAATAWAHGGLPETSNLSVRRGHEGQLIAGATIGAVISVDSGQSWRWICPEAMGIGAWRPERYFWLTGGALLAASGSALIRSDDGGCTWSSHPFFKDTWVTNLAVHPTNERLMYAVTGKPSTSNGIFRSEDGGETWKAILTPGAGAHYSAIRIAPSDPQRLYASGEDTAGPFFSRSDDGGQSWTRLPQPLPQLQRPYDLVLLLVSEASADVLWTRISAQGLSFLFKSTDGGATLTEAMNTPDVIVGAEGSADGRTIWVSTPVHLYRSREPEPFAELPLPNGNACALRVGSTLYSCGSSWVHDWALARSQDEGTSWQPVFGLSNIQGSQVCPASTSVQEFCPSRWPQLASILGVPTYGDGGVESPDGGDAEPPGPPAKKGCSTTDGLVPTALLLVTFTLGRRSRRAFTRRA